MYFSERKESFDTQKVPGYNPGDLRKDWWKKTMSLTSYNVFNMLIY